MSPSAKPSIGFVGLGAMGYGIATNLVKQGYQVYGYDLSEGILNRFAREGGHACQALVESTRNVDYYICMVASAPQAQGVLFEEEDPVVKTLRHGAVFILSSTVPASYAISVKEQFQKLGRDDIYFVDAPVSGGVIRAAAGTLTIMAGGSEAALEKSEWLLKEMSAPDKLFITGGIGAGSNMKMAHQVLAGIQILAASEVMGFASKLGVDPRILRDEVCKSDGWSWMFENRVPRMLEEDYFPGVSALTVILKDVVIITSSALQQNFPTPLVSIAEQIYLSALTLGFGGHDDAGMVRTYYTHPISQVPEYFARQPDKLRSEPNIALIIRLLKAIHLCAAAEAISFAKHLGINLNQFYKLCVDAAGGSVMFREKGLQMVHTISEKNLKANSGVENGVHSAATIRDFINDLDDVLKAAQKVQSPLHLGTAARNLLLLAERRLGKQARDFEVIKFWEWT